MTERVSLLDPREPTGPLTIERDLLSEHFKIQLNSENFIKFQIKLSPCGIFCWSLDLKNFKSQFPCQQLEGSNPVSNRVLNLLKIGPILTLSRR